MEVPGAVPLSLAAGVVHLDEPEAVFDAMLTGWARQQKSRLLGDSTVAARLALVRRFTAFTGTYPWQWTAADVEDFTMSLMSGDGRLAPSTIRGHHMSLKLFCDYLLDGRYDWVSQCETRFDEIPSQVCHDFNTAAHLVEYEGRPERRPFSYAELQTLFDYLDDRVDRIARSGRKGALAALRDAQMIKTAYAFGVGRRELCFLDVADLRPNASMPQWGTYGALHVRYGKSSRGSAPRRRTVLAVPEFDWVIDGLRQWVEEARPLLAPGQRGELWLTERKQRVATKTVDRRFSFLRQAAGLPAELTLHCLRHSYVTHLIEFGYPERFVTDQVGHSYASTTAIYTSVSNDFKTKTLQGALARVYPRAEEMS